MREFQARAGIVQIGRLGGEHGNALGAVAARGRSEDPEAGIQQGLCPLRNRTGTISALIGAGQRSSVAPRAAAFGYRKPVEVLHEFSGYVEDGRVGDLLEPLEDVPRIRICR